MIAPDKVVPYQILEYTPSLVRLHYPKPFKTVLALACVSPLIIHFTLDVEYFLSIVFTVIFFGVYQIILAVQPTDIVVQPRVLELHYHGILWRKRTRVFRQDIIREIRSAPYWARSSYASVQLIDADAKTITFFASPRDSMSQASEHSDILAREVASVSGFPVTLTRPTQTA